MVGLERETPDWEVRLTGPRDTSNVTPLAHPSMCSLTYTAQPQDSNIAQRPQPRLFTDSRKPVLIRSTRPNTMPPPTANHLLAALPEAEYQRVAPHLEPVDLPLGLALHEVGSRLTHVYFQTSGIVSLLHVLEDGSSAEIAVKGWEGVVGVSLFMGGGTTTSRAVVQCAGQAYRLRADYMQQEFERGGVLQIVLLRFTQALITQMAQTAVCNRHHSIDQQLCRWLLLSLDRLPGNQISMTQELIANMLGVRREGVTSAAGLLRRAKLISYRRGLITVLDRPALEKRVCECYAVVKKESDRLLTRRLAPAQAALGPAE